MKAKPILTKCLFYLLFLLTILCPTATGKIIYVDDDAPVSSVEDSNGGTNDGTSWQNAYTFLQDALSDANDSDKPVEVRVAQGIYKPDQGINISMLPFLLINEVTLAGGYAGLAEQDPNERNFERYETILSGDLAGNDIDVNNLRDLLDEPTRSDNIPIIYSGYSIDQTAVLDGFIITGGCNRAVPFEIVTGGGGIRIDRGSSPTISNCTLIGNAALACGGGMLTRKDSNPTIINCKFIENYAGGGGGVYNASSNPVFSHCLFKGNYARSRGGGMGNYNELFWGLEQNCNPVIINCIFSGNYAEQDGGGMYCGEGSNSVLTNCRFTDNYALGEGGAIDSYKGDSRLIDCVFENNHAYIGGSCVIESVEISFINCAFVGNKALSEGGGISNSSRAYGISNVHFENCLFTGNSSGWIGGAINFREKINGEIRNCTISHNWALYGEGLCFKPFHTPTNNFKITSSILWGSSEQIYNGNNSKITITYSDIQGGWEGEGNIDEDPLFAEPGYWSDVNDVNVIVEPNNPNAVLMNGDYHLKSKAGRFDPNSGSWVMDDVTSPCINAGDPNSFIGDEPIPNGCWINMGAFGGSSQASLSFGDANIIVDQASEPVPADGAEDIEVDDIILSWMSDPNALMYKVYFGTDNQPPFIRRQLENEFNPGTLELNTHYYWRIDEIDDLCNKITGILWEFTTAPLHSRATNPNPVNKAVNVELDAKLSWSPGLNAIAHDVYLGTDFNNVSNATTTNTLGVLVSRRQGSNSYNPRSLEYGRTYYWRVDEADNQGMIVTGQVWSFKTASAPITPPKGRACFTGETHVWIDGAIIPISEVTTGQNIRHLNIYGKVEKVQEHEGTFNLYDIALESGNFITVAENHYFMTEAGSWISLHELKAGSRLKTSKGSVGIISVKKRPKPYIGRVYNLKIKDSDQYIIGEDAVIVRDY